MARDDKHLQSDRKRFSKFGGTQTARRMLEDRLAGFAA